jgi:1-acyl-sn-glycerol-3-phosphate acyltransferase
MLRTGLVILVVFGLILLVLPFLIVIAWVQGKPDVLYLGARLGSRLGLKLAGVCIEVQGLEQIDPKRTYLFLANHQGNCDPFALLPAIPQDTRYIVKEELLKVPILGIGMKMGRFVVIDRKDRMDSLRGMNQAVVQLQQGESFLVFPEGTRTRTGKMGGFKKGPFMMAIQAAVPIVPITIDGSYEVMPPTRFRINPGMVRLIFHPPIDTRGMVPEDRDSLKERVRQMIASGLAEAKEEA